jgi:hypothetical protein
MMMALGAGVIVPNVLRWYWWRMNGWGYAWGTLGGLLLSLGALFFKEAPDYYVFPVIAAASALACVLGSLATRPVPTSTLTEFYRTVRPFGVWGAIERKADLEAQSLPSSGERMGRALLNTVLGMLAILAFYLSPMFLVGHAYLKASLWAGAGTTAVLILRFTWYRHLPTGTPES